MANEKRLIDAYALLGRLANSSESWAKNIKAIRNWWPHAVGIKDNIVSLIKDAPTVDAVEVVHGHWYKAPHHPYRCSCCGEMALLDMYGESHYRSNYCPNCGAKMDGGNEDG